MAALMNYGTLPQLHAQMHPFFRPAPRTTNAVPPLDRRDPYSTGLDGTSDIPELEKFVDNDIKNSHVPSEKLEVAQRSELDQDYLDIDLTTHEAKVDEDSDRERRKRRKITPCEGTQSANEPAASDVGLAADMRKTQSQMVSGNAHSSPSRHADAVDVSTEISDAIFSSPARRRSSRLTPVKNRLSNDETSSLRFDQSPEPLSRRKPHLPKAAGTPHKSPSQKKMLQLTKEGKLANSPKKTMSQDKVKTNLTASRPRNLAVKKGQIVPSLRVALSYNTDDVRRVTTGRQIDDILQGQYQAPYSTQPQQGGTKATIQKESTKITHPFFLGKAGTRRGSTSSLNTAQASSTVNDSEAEMTNNSKIPKPWNEIVFGTAKVSHTKGANTLNALWPPRELQHVHSASGSLAPIPVSLYCARDSKKKSGASQVPVDHDILLSFGTVLRDAGRPLRKIHLPERELLSGFELCSFSEQGQSSAKSAFQSNPSALGSVRARALRNLSAFDRGMAAGPQIWAQEYAPQRSEDVLQTQSQILHDWLKKLKVHQVKSGAVGTEKRSRSKPTARKRQAKKRIDEMDDFIASSDDESTSGSPRVKNAILICGPSGCGKTASIYAVAQELGFEVFEIHSGMRRSNKDIFDKVGDMTQNHLVQQSNALSRNSSTLTEDLNVQSAQQDFAIGKQQTMANYMPGSKKFLKLDDVKDDPQEARERLQKQSLILFEEVDNLFDDDKSFWSGVQSLIQQSKRPVILTCNNPESIPLSELELHATLFYEKQSVELATEYLGYLAAAEGHLLDRTALSSLYLSKGCDLRASITELNLWCQMGVGSEFGGLDWMPQHGQESTKDPAGNFRRIISRSTFSEGLDLLPEAIIDRQELFEYAYGSLEMSALDWQPAHEGSSLYDPTRARIDALEEASLLADARSCMDIVDDSLTPLLSVVVSEILQEPANSVDRKDIVRNFLNRVKQQAMARPSLVAAFEPLREDFRTFPPVTGRTAPSLDSGVLSLATDVAPYVRAIVSFDQRLEQQRKELAGSSQTKRARTTRAARAALEGGSKADVRRERWFPKDLDFVNVLRTGNDWPQYVVDLEPEAQHMTPTSTQTIAVDGDQ